MMFNLPQGWRFRVNEFGNIILQRYSKVRKYTRMESYLVNEWRDATLEDLEVSIPQNEN